MGATMNIDDLARHLSSQIVVEVSPDRQYISTGFIYPDGDSVNIYLSQKRENGTVSDGGTTCEKLADRGISLRKGHKSVVDFIQNRFGVQVVSGVVTKDLSSEEDYGQSCLAVCEAVAFLASLSYQKTESRTSQFQIEVDRFMDERISPKRQFERKWTDARVDPNGVFPVDYRMNGAGTPRHLFAISSGGKTELVAAVTSFLKLNGVGIPTVAIVDPESTLGDTKAHRLELVLDAIYFGIKGQEKQIESFALDSEASL